MTHAPKVLATTSEAPDLPLDGARIVITGRLASMKREEARERLESAGAKLLERPTVDTDFLVVGHGGPPLDESGRPTKALTRARKLREAGSNLEIVTEEDFLVRLGLTDERDHLRRLYTTAQIARILEVSPRTVRSWIRHELIRPAKVVRRLSWFDFRQVASAKALSQLAQDGVTPARLRKSLVELQSWLPETANASELATGDGPIALKGPDVLHQLEALEGGLLALRTDEGRLIESSGQLRFDFDQPCASDPTEDDFSAEEWFERGVEAEEAEHFMEAVEAYEHALDLGGPVPEYSFNLGNVLYILERKPEAARHLARATDTDPEFVEAWNNLGNVLGDIDMPREALTAYRRALVIEPDYADAHFNLAETLFTLGETRRALEHWRAYLAQDPFSSWATRARERLDANE